MATPVFLLKCGNMEERHTEITAINQNHNLGASLVITVHMNMPQERLGLQIKPSWVAPVQEEG